MSTPRLLALFAILPGSRRRFTWRRARQRVNELVRGKRGVTPETAWLLAQALSTTPEYWLDLQTAHDLTRGRPAEPVEPLKVAG